jgi:hypothetical protein
VAFGAPFPDGNQVKGFLVSPWQVGGEDVGSFGASFGVESRDRILVACAYGALNISHINALSIGGVGAALMARSIVANANGGGEMSDIWAAAVPTGTSGGVGISYTVHGFVGFSLYALYGARSVTPDVTNAANGNPQSLPLNVRGGSFAIGNASCFALGSFSWSRLTEDSNSIRGSTSQTSASARFPGAQLVPIGLILPTSSDACGVCAAWSP